MPPLLSLVIVSYNTAALLRRCLASLPATVGGAALEVIVVDNASPDDSAALVAREFPAARLLALTTNTGFAAANNAGLRLAQGRYLGLLNADTEVAPGALDTLVDWLASHPAAGVVAPRLVNPDGSTQAVGFRFPGLAQTALDWFPLHPRLMISRLNGRYPPPWPSPFQIDHPLGAAFIVRRTAARQVGLLDSGYFMYSEEVDWCHRLVAAGWQCWVLPAVTVLHHGGSSTRQQPARMFEELHRSRDRYLRQWLPPLTYRLTRLVTRLGTRVERRRTRQRLQHGQLTPEAAQARLAACERIDRGWPVHAPAQIGRLPAGPPDAAAGDEASPLPLTVIVLARNEARHIRACLEAAQIVRPTSLLVLDSESTDATRDEAAAAGARVVVRPFDGFARQRDAALALAATEWIYFVDADERVTPAQAAEIADRLAVDGLAGYWVPRDNRICGHRMRGGGWWPDEQLRLFRRTAGRYDPTRQVHELVVIDGPVGHLVNPMIHYNYDTWGQILAKQSAYTRQAVLDAAAAGQRVRPQNYLLQPLRAFVRRFVTLKGYRDGWVGLLLALILAAYELVFYIQLGRYRPPNTQLRSG